MAVVRAAVVVVQGDASKRCVSTPADKRHPFMVHSCNELQVFMVVSSIVDEDNNSGSITSDPIQRKWHEWGV